MTNKLSPDAHWAALLARANKIFGERRGSKAAAARELNMKRQELHKVLRGEHEPRAGIALALHSILNRLQMQSVHLSSEYDSWTTPAWLYDSLNALFSFNLDAAADAGNAKCPEFFDRSANGLLQSWAGRRVWLNPPYREPAWFEKSYRESRDNGALVALLCAARPDTEAWHSYVDVPGNEVVFLKGRVRFSGSRHAAPFPSALVVFGGNVGSAQIKRAIENARPLSKRLNLKKVVPNAIPAQTPIAL